MSLKKSNLIAGLIGITGLTLGCSEKTKNDSEVMSNQNVSNVSAVGSPLSYTCGVNTGLTFDVVKNEDHTWSVYYYGKEGKTIDGLTAITYPDEKTIVLGQLDPYVRLSYDGWTQKWKGIFKYPTSITPGGRYSEVNTTCKSPESKSSNLASLDCNFDDTPLSATLRKTGTTWSLTYRYKQNALPSEPKLLGFKGYRRNKDQSENTSASRIELRESVPNSSDEPNWSASLWKSEGIWNMQLNTSVDRAKQALWKGEILEVNLNPISFRKYTPKDGKEMIAFNAKCTTKGVDQTE